jgi:Carbohydrate esterase, sialic acid-specific acetylesterase
MHGWRQESTGNSARVRNLQHLRIRCDNTFYIMKRVIPIFLAAASALAGQGAGQDLQLFLLIGQSNMAGRGKIEPRDVEPIPGVFMLNKEKQFVPAIDPVHFDKPTIAGVGIARSFAQVLLKANPALKIGLIPSAVGGTSLDQWKPDGELYRNALERARHALKSGRLRGILWHQGEADSGKEALAKSYRERFAAMIRQLRQDLEAPDLPVVVGELGEFHQSAFNDFLNRELALLPFSVPHSAFVSSAGLTDKGDHTHFDAPSVREFGRRYGLAFLSLDPAWAQ